MYYFDSFAEVSTEFGIFNSTNRASNVSNTLRTDGSASTACRSSGVAARRAASIIGDAGAISLIDSIGLDGAVFLSALSETTG